ncbi:unnamed protein product [Somion occarium]|uniref:Alpha/beta hydrolase fold-3 domain-containing protein n=1 Tax=Somion occarium TaxID=3059160 RepID=A0ABP1E1C1_9APHY
MASNAHLLTPDPEIAALLAKMPSMPAVENPTIEEQRAYLHDSLLHWQERLPSESEYRIEDHLVPVDGGEIKVRCVIPTSSEHHDKGPLPLLVWYHGGGYCVGSSDLDDGFLRVVAVKTGVVVINVEYRLAPVFPFPTGVNDAYAALKWAAENATRLSASPSRGFIVAGLSAGGNFSASVAIRARDDPFFTGRQLTGQLLQNPHVLDTKAVPEQYKAVLLSMEEVKDGPYLTRKAMERVCDPSDPRYSVLLAANHSGLPPAYIQVAGLDPLRDEGILYAKVLRESDVKTKLDIYPGLPHGGHILFPGASLSAKVYQDFDTGLKWLLHGNA